VLNSDLSEGELCIFNHWGQLIYQGDNIHSGWDGTINGTNAQAGNYTYLINGKNASGESRNFNGIITLIR